MVLRILKFEVFCQKMITLTRYVILALEYEDLKFFYFLFFYVGFYACTLASFFFNLL